MCADCLESKRVEMIIELSGPAPSFGVQICLLSYCLLGYCGDIINIKLADQLAGGAEHGGSIRVRGKIPNVAENAHINPSLSFSPMLGSAEVTMILG